MSPLRICHIGVAEKARAAWQILERVQHLGFDTVLVEPRNSEGVSPTFAHACQSRGTSLVLDLDLYELDIHHPLVSAYPDSFAIRRIGEPGTVADPRAPSAGHGRAYLREAHELDALIRWWSRRIVKWLEAGVRGFRLLKPTETTDR